MKSTAKVGDKFTTNEGYTATIIEYNGWYDCKIILDDGVILEKIILGSLKTGKVKNPFHRTAFGVGYFGKGVYNGGAETVKYYEAWKSMLQRCYDPKYQEKQPTYIGCTVCEEWHNFQNFAKWIEENYVQDWCLDKDLIAENNKIYSPETCCFVPREINNILLNKKSNGGNLPIGVVKKKGGRFQALMSKKGKK